MERSDEPSFKPRRPGGIGSNFIKAKQKEEAGEHNSRKVAIRWLTGTYVSNFMALVVLFDSYCTCADIDARAIGEDAPAVLMLLSDVCLALYTLELVLLVLLKGFGIFAKDTFLISDAVVILCGFVELIISNTMNADNLAGFNLLRTLRFARIIRLLRLLRKTRSLRELQKLVTMMATCLKALAWSFLFCFVIMTIWAMLMVEVVCLG
ncbi:unnamed protein product [Effrenium voratum]|uniref:Ion transport domain-containing protein n=1 Tax=Effrenium voratum TaxID=2562239 RepID=A0AA36N2D2_9DINO|nr:unnamed protein product [Effrenium voratum]